MWGEKIILVRELLEEEARGKILLFESSNKFKIESFAESFLGLATIYKALSTSDSNCKL